MRGPVAVATCVVVALLAGCSGSSPGDGGGPSSSSSTGPVPASFDGEAAYGFVEMVVTAPDGSPAFRVPGTPAHVEAAQRLHGALDVDGWTVGWQNFTGEQYKALAKGEVQPYYDSPAYCKAADKERLGGLTFSNLVASKPGTGADRTFLFAAHWESKRFATQDADPAKRTEAVLGANDGASGVGVLLQLMRELDGVDLGFGVMLVLFDGEDGFEDCHPLAGSLWFVHAQQEAAALMGASPPLPMGGGRQRVLLLDMVGDPDARFIRETHSEKCDPELVDLLHEKAAGQGLAENFPGGGSTIQDDHVPFTQAGIPAVDLIDFGRGFPPYWHTTHDTMENLDAGMLGRVGGLLLDVLEDDALSGPWPAGCS
jgi:hypothetical protein